MLAKATKSVSEIIDKFQGREYTCEYKYDGERAQVQASLMGISYFYILPMLISNNTIICKIHCMEDGTVEIYSRNAERNTGKYPDVVDAISRYTYLLISPTNLLKLHAYMC